MKKKNGFISTTVIYSFFIIFVVVLVYIVNNYTNTRIMQSSFKETILNDISDTNFARYLMNNYTTLSLSRHNSDLDNGSGDESYRYYGEDAENYVCFSTYATCTEDNMYRVIGVINGRVKLIKATALTTTSYDTNDTNVFSLSTIYTYLNNEYLSSLGDIADYIETTTWYTGGVDYKVVYDPENTTDASAQVTYLVYDYELGTNRNASVTTVSKIALAYASDYGYAQAPGYYGGKMSGTTNWMDDGADFWLATPISSYYNYSCYIKSDGSLYYDIVSASKEIRPVFFLKNTAEKTSGSGTLTDPYIIDIV